MANPIGFWDKKVDIYKDKKVFSYFFLEKRQCPKNARYLRNQTYNEHNRFKMSGFHSFMIDTLISAIFHLTCHSGRWRYVLVYVTQYLNLSSCHFKYYATLDVLRVNCVHSRNSFFGCNLPFCFSLSTITDTWRPGLGYTLFRGTTAEKGRCVNNCINN